jgi:peptide/nickel transport system ATP-binding protein/glutathione transport system ATP-binding protein
VQYVFQDPFASLDPRLTIGFSIAEPISTHRLLAGAAVERRVHELLRLVGLLPEHARRYPHELSGGQRQRCCIARALASEPSLIIADEAVAALDVSIRAQVVNLLMELQARLGVAYLFISHDMAVVERIAHRIAVMYAGRIVEIGDAKSVLSDPQHGYTRRLIAAVPAIERRRQHFALDATQVPSLVRPPGYEPPPAQWREVGQDHRVRVEESA